MTGQELAAIRKAAGLTQVELARRAGISRDAVSYWENKSTVRRSSGGVAAIAKVLKLPADKSPVYSARTTWADRLMASEWAAIELARARWAAQEAERAAKRRVVCGAKTRKGTDCRCKSEPGKRRCKFHGGKSTGARTPEGIERIRKAQRQRWANWRAGQ